MNSRVTSRVSRIAKEKAGSNSSNASSSPSNSSGGYGGYYIPQQTFGLYFGRQHFFRIRSRPTIYMGYPRFYYGGFSFLLVDPWPEYWPENWYVANDVYIDYDDGYYLYNRNYPGVGLAITIVL